MQKEKNPICLTAEVIQGIFYVLVSLDCKIKFECDWPFSESKPQFIKYIYICATSAQ